MTNQLPKVKIDSKLYYQDDRLQEYRQVTNPPSKIPYDEIDDRTIEPVKAKESFTKKQKLQ